MGKLIEIYDDIIPQYQQDYIESLLTNKIEGHKVLWEYQSILTNSEDTNPIQPKETGFFLDIFASPYIFSLLTPFYKYCDLKNFIPSKITLARSFLQTPSPYSGIQHPHIDSSKPHLVFLYYVCDSDGDTIFYDDNKKIIKRVPPKKGRLAIFDGLISHSGSSPSKSPRIVINLNFHP